jgi:cytochrome c-type biogenesis protein CcmH/NrfG
VEAKLQREPDNPNLWLALARTRVAAGNALVEVNPQTGEPVVNAEAQQDFDRATGAWNRYLAQSDEVNSSAALLIANTYFTLARSGTSVEEIVANLNGAAAAQRLATEARPSAGLLTTLATYEYFAGNFKAADRAGEEAKSKATGQEKKQVEEQLTEYRQRGKQWATEKKRAAKAEKEQGKEALQNPFGGLTGSSGLGE